MSTEEWGLGMGMGGVRRGISDAYGMRFEGGGS